MLGAGTGSELRQPLGYAMVGGLAFSQVLTLYTTPVIYIYLDKLQSWLSGHREEAEEAEPVVTDFAESRGVGQSTSAARWARRRRSRQADAPCRELHRWRSHVLAKKRLSEISLVRRRDAGPLPFRHDKSAT